jgi:hypothetical protein
MNAWPVPPRDMAEALANPEDSFEDPEPFLETTQGWRAKREPNRGHWVKAPRTHAEYKRDIGDIHLLDPKDHGWENMRTESRICGDMSRLNNAALARIAARANRIIAGRREDGIPE